MFFELKAVSLSLEAALKKYEFKLVMLSERFNLNSVGWNEFSLEPDCFKLALTNESGSVNCS